MMFGAPRRMGISLNLPGSIDHRPWMRKAVGDQGEERSCVGFALAAMKEWQEKREWGREIELSPRFIYEEARSIGGYVNDEGGTDLRSGMEALRRKGVCEEDFWPYVAQPSSRPVRKDR